MLVEIVIESFGAVVAGIVGFVTYRRLNSFYRSLFIQLLTWLILYLVSYVVTEYQRYTRATGNNHWVFNLNILFETLFLLVAARNFFIGIFMKRVILIFVAVFIFVSMILHLRGDFLTFNVPVYILESILVILIYTYLLFKCFYEIFTEETRRSEIWSSVGIILYFGCNLPYFSLFHFLNTHYINMSITLQDHITDVLSNIRYLLLAIGFWMASGRSRTTIQQS